MTLATYELLIDFAADGFTVATTETGSPARGAGQFTNFNSCTISNAAVADRVQIGALPTAQDFAFIIYLAPTNAHNAAGQPAHGTVLDWRNTANERIELWYDKGNARWSLDVVHGGVTEVLTLADTWAASDAKTLYVDGSATTLRIGTNAGALTSAARTQIPTGLPATLDVGSVAAATQFEATYACVAEFSAALAAADWVTLASLARPPLFGEVVARAMCALWYGKDTAYYDSILDIVTPDLYELNCDRGRSYASQLTGRSEAGWMRAELRNVIGRYSSFNAASPIFGNITPSRKVRLRAADATQHYAMWAGFIDNIEPHPGMPPTATLTARGPLILLSSNRIGAVASSGALTGTILGLILDAAGWSASDRSIEAGQTTTGRWYSQDRGALEAAREIEETELGFISESADGKIVFEDRHHRLLTVASVVSQATYSDAAGAARPYLNIAPSAPLREIFNQISVPIQTYSVAGLAVLWTLTGETPTLAPGESRSWDAEYPVNASGGLTGAYVAAWTTPVIATDITQTGVANGDIGIAAVKISNKMTITVTNNGAAVATLTLMQARGTAVSVLDPVTVSASDASSIAKYGQRTHELPAKWLANSDEGRDFGHYIVSRYKDDHPVLGMALDGSRDATMLAEVLSRQLSERVTVVANGFKTYLGIAEDFFVESIRFAISRLRVLTATLALSSVGGDGGYWLMGISELGVDTKMGY